MALEALWPIVWLSLKVSGAALVVAALAGVPLGAVLALRPVPGRRLIELMIFTGMGLPPVVVGLAVYLLLSRSGPLGGLNALFAPAGMTAAQALIATPLVAGLTLAAVEAVDPDLRLQLKALGASPRQVMWAVLGEARGGVLAAILAAFGRVISEVGAVMLVGGNIEGQTRVLTTAIVLETRRGNFALALALGAVLLSLALAANALLLRWGRGLAR